MEPVRVKRVEGTQSMGVAGSGHGVLMDAGASDSGARPTELVLMALGGCIGINVVAMLKKVRVAVDGFEMRIQSTRAEKPPRRFTRIEVEFLFWGDAIPPEKVERAIALSRDKYCSVGATLARIGRNRHPISHPAFIEGELSSLLRNDYDARQAAPGSAGFQPAIRKNAGKDAGVPSNLPAAAITGRMRLQ